MHTVPASLSWRAHPARERRLATAATLSVMALASFSSGLFMQQPVWSLFAVGLLTWSLRRYLFPTRFQIDDRGITLTTWFDHRFVGWAEVVHWQADHHSALIAGRRTTAGRIKGRPLELLFGAQRDAALNALRFHTGRDDASRRTHTAPGVPGESPACDG